MGMGLNFRPVITSTITGKTYPDTKAGRDQMDRDEGRVRIPNSAMEAMVTLQAAMIVARKAADAIKPTIRKTGCGRMLKAHIGGMRRCIGDILCKVSASQNRTLQANTQLVTVTVSSAKAPAMINIPIEDMVAISNRALEMCAFSCSCTREQSKECQLRRAFEQVASSCVEAVRDDPTKCPYAGTGFEIDDLEGEAAK